MFIIILLLLYFAQLTHSYCTTGYWNPLNNACVDRIVIHYIQFVPGFHPTSTMPILPLIAA